MSSHITSATEALQRLRPGTRVVATQTCATPTTLLDALGDVAREIAGLSLTSGLMLGEQSFLDSVRSGALRLRAWQVGPEQRSAMRSGLIEYVPLRAGDIPDWLPGRFDVLLARMSPPDHDGWCNLGPSSSWTRAAIDAASMVIAEFDPTFPVTYGETAVHIAEIDVAVESTTPMPLYRSAPTTPTTDAIARHVVDLLPRDPFVQLGIGAVPETVAGSLAGAGLGEVQLVGMGCDAMVDLIDRGAGGRRPGLRSVELMGTDVLMRAAHRNPRVEMLPSSRCHDPRWLASLPRLVSINSAVELDLLGQVASETVAGTVIGGIGGSFDFFEGAHLSDGGLRIVALPSTTPDGTVSRIVPRLAPGTPVTLPRHCVDTVVTEHGVARLTGRSERERVEALIGVAAPQHRDALADQVDSA